jgi:hypothetical protein
MLNEIQKRFFEPQGAEELYDLSVDPYETKNLATVPVYRSTLENLRILLKGKLLEENDLGFYPECVWLEQGSQNPTGFGKKKKDKIKIYSDIADLEMASFKDAKPAISKALNSSDPVERYWGATVCASFGGEAVSLYKELELLTVDTQAFVRSRAIVALSRMGKVNPVPLMKEALQIAGSGAESLLILNDITYLQESNLGVHFNLQESDILQKCSVTDWRLKYLSAK